MAFVTVLTGGWTIKHRDRSVASDSYVMSDVQFADAVGERSGAAFAEGAGIALSKRLTRLKCPCSSVVFLVEVPDDWGEPEDAPH